MSANKKLSRFTLFEKVFLVILISIFMIPIFIYAAFSVLTISVNNGLPLTHSRADKELQQNMESFNIIIEYFLNVEFSNISVQNDMQLEDGAFEMFVGLEAGRVVISDPYVSDAIKRLFGQGYRGITKRENGISFLRWATLGAGRGIVFSIDGSPTTQADGLQFLIEIQPLSEDGWYFYAEGFNEWRSRNRWDFVRTDL